MDFQRNERNVIKHNQQSCLCSVVRKEEEVFLATLRKSFGAWCAKHNITYISNCFGSVFDMKALVAVRKLIFSEFSPCQWFLILKLKIKQIAAAQNFSNRWISRLWCGKVGALQVNDKMIHFVTWIIFCRYACLEFWQLDLVCCHLLFCSAQSLFYPQWVLLKQYECMNIIIIDFAENKTVQRNSIISHWSKFLLYRLFERWSFLWRQCCDIILLYSQIDTLPAKKGRNNFTELLM